MCSGLGLYGQIEQRNPLSHRHVDLTKTLPYTSPIPITNNTHNRTTIPYCTIHHSIICSDNDVSSHVSDRRRRPLIMQHLHCLHITYSAYREVLNIFVAIGSDIIETIVDDAAASHQRIARCTQNDRGGRRSAMGNVHPPSRLGWRMVGNLVHV